MDWKDVGGIVGKFAPLLGGVLGGPGGAALGSVVASVLGVENTPDAIHKAIIADPEAAVKLAQIESDERVKLQGMALAQAEAEIAASAAVVSKVNDTMQAETKGEHWPTYSWRPFNGFVVGTMAFGCYFVLPLCKVPVPTVPTEVWLMFGGILGVASWFRGKAQEAQANMTPGAPDAKG